MKNLAKNSITSITRIEYNEFISEYVGTEVYLKREDLQDSIKSGVKIRQVECLLNYAKAENINPIIIDGFPNSNCLKAICYYALEYNINIHLILKGKKPKKKSCNYIEIMSSGFRKTWISDFNLLENTRSELINFYQRKNLFPLVIPAGANSNLTIHGSIGLGIEIAKQEKELGICFSHIILPVGTGGTLSGIEISKAFHARSWDVIGVRIDDYDTIFYSKNYENKISFLHLTADQKKKISKKLNIYDDALFHGYGMYTKKDLREIEYINSNSKILFGPTYSFKCLTGLKNMVNERKIRNGSKVLLIHTGIG